MRNVKIINGIVTGLIQAHELRVWDAVLFGDTYYLVEEVSVYGLERKVKFSRLDQARAVHPMKWLRIAEREEF